MGLEVLQGTPGKELPQMLVEVAMVVIAVDGVVKAAGRLGYVGGCFADAHDLQGVLAADAGSTLKIALQRAGRDAVLFGHRFNRRLKVIFPETPVKDLSNDLNLLQGTCMFLYDRVIVVADDPYSFIEGAGCLDGVDKGLIDQVAERKYILPVLCEIHFLQKQYRRDLELNAK